MKLLCVGAHLDDCVLSIGQTLAGRSDATILTVFAGGPVTEGLLTPYDEMCGFASSAKAVAARRAENDAACAVLGVEHVNGTWLDGQYGEPTSDSDLTSWLTKQMTGWERFDTVLLPVGIGHPDHVQVAGCALDAACSLDVRIGVYLEIPSYVRQPIEAVRALDGFAGWKLTPAELPLGDRDVKRKAVECYASQLGPDMRAHAYVPEHIWWLNR